MYYDTRMQFEYEIMMNNIENEMHNMRSQALKKLASEIAHSKNVESFANILAYSWFDSVPDAEKIADELNLCKLDFLAIKEDLEAFKEEYSRNDFVEVLNEYAI